MANALTFTRSAWITVFQDTAQHPHALAALASQPGFDASLRHDGWTLPWAALGPAQFHKDGVPVRGAESTNPWPDGREELLLDLLRAGAAFDTPHPTSGADWLSVAVGGNHPKLLEALLALPNAANAVDLAAQRLPATNDGSGMRMAAPWLHGSLRRNNLAVFNVLVAHGLDPNQPDDRNRPPMWWAVSPEGVKVALAAGADPHRLADGMPVDTGWLDRPPETQRAMLEVLRQHGPAIVNNPAERAIEQLARFSGLGDQPGARAAAVLDGVTDEAWQSARFDRVEPALGRTVAWGPVGWVARSWMRTRHGNKGEGVAAQVAHALRNSTGLQPEDWTHESLPGVPDGILLAAAVLSWGSGKELDSPSAKDTAIRCMRAGLGGKPVAHLHDPFVWDLLWQADSAFQTLDQVSLRRRRKLWQQPVASLSSPPQPIQRWPWNTLRAMLAVPELAITLLRENRLDETLNMALGFAGDRSGAAERAERLGGPALWGALVHVGAGAGNFPPNLTLLMLDEWVRRYPSVVERAAALPDGAFVRISIEALAEKHPTTALAAAERSLRLNEAVPELAGTRCKSRL